jgi:signal peptidase I
MWLLVVGAIVLVIVIVLIREALGFEMTTKPGLSMQENIRERDELVNRWFSGNRLPDDEERMFEEFYEGDVDAPEWN